MGHVPMLVEEHDDDDVSPAATGIKLSKWREGKRGFAFISARLLAQCQMSIAICKTTVGERRNARTVLSN